MRKKNTEKKVKITMAFTEKGWEDFILTVKVLQIYPTSDLVESFLRDFTIKNKAFVIEKIAKYQNDEKAPHKVFVDGKTGEIL